MNQALAIRASPKPSSNFNYQSPFYPTLSNANTFHAENQKPRDDLLNYSKVKYRVVEGRPLVNNNVIISKEMRKYTLEYRVNKIMQATNWKPIGGVAVINNGKEIMLTQAMCREDIPIVQNLKQIPINFNSGTITNPNNVNSGNITNPNNVNSKSNTRRNSIGGRRRTNRR
jgi:hypothetical protein